MDWITAAQDRLWQLRGDAGGWGYRQGAPSYVEPTVLASLSLLSTSKGQEKASKAVARAADWLASLQQPSGCLGLSAKHPDPHWPTTYALLLWSATGTHDDAQTRALAWLLRREGNTFAKGLDAVIGHDTEIPGWPWIDNTHSWVEPTALALIALNKVERQSDKRFGQGMQLLCDRVIETGGWNYGNNVVFGSSLRARPAPTGLALLALASTSVCPDAVKRSVSYLTSTLPTVRAAQSLGWGLLSLKAWRSWPDDADRWLGEAYEKAASRIDAASQLAYLLLAAGPQSLTLLGLDENGREIDG